MIAHPQEHAPLALSALRYGPILFLLAPAWYLRTVPRVSSLVHLIGSAALLALGFASLTAPEYLVLMMAAASLATLATFDRR